ncbi:MAG: transglutaminase family protein [Rhodocyclaceae bacterium]|nr:transglutaminase family protein [Rhodocyclaceae bacterium]
MTIRVALHHKTLYRYDRPVALSPHVMRLRPAVHSRTPIESYSLRVTPEPHFLNWQQDPFGNYLGRVVFPERTLELSIQVDIVADMTVINPFDFFLEEAAEHFPFEYEAHLRKDLAPYLEVRESGPHLRRWLDGVDRSRMRTVDFLVSVNQRLARDVAYTIRMEPGVQTCEQTLERALGSCRDTGWVLVQVLRHMGLAARFVSGYLVQLVADQKPLEGPSGPTEDFTDLHAWAEVYIPGAGWVGLDPTSGLFAGEGHIPLACTPDPESAAAVTGFTDECKVVTFEYANTVTRIHEDPRVTRPYSPDQWARIDALGQQVDADLQAGDVRLTMGGEPTFVSIDDMESPQWTIAADGDAKRERANVLVRRLRETFGPGGMLYHGQGKWYPGEPLPRWLLAVFWRADGRPVWHDASLLADTTKDYGHGLREAEAFAQELTERLGLPTVYLQPGHEDTLYYIHAEQNLPDNVDPLSANLKDPLERQRLARLLQRGLGEATGFALPLAWDTARNRWLSGNWTFRRGHMYLLPGDSAMGYRLPLDALPQLTPEQRLPFIERSLMQPLPGLPDYGRARALPAAAGPAMAPASSVQRPAAALASTQGGASHQPNDAVRTALCIEPREGRLYVFLPPLAFLEHFLELVGAIEASAAALGLPVVIEGYPPPRDPRLVRLPVTPDPGVIEVNIHPASSWTQLVDNTQALYREARETRLATEKFMLDGRHTGTGGGNHITIGAATPADSPILRRPDLLRSLISYWQNHPSLSYLFSGMFIGPTSQAPRVDEARNESLYELEIAFRQLPTGDVAQPWLVDRLLRNLLIDSTGNTHRTEFCIDKLHSPEGETGRLGLVELRAFEMPPHPQMALVQAALLRALIARFWKDPYNRPLVRWGTELHDRFMLPHYVRSDIADVVADLQAAGYPFSADWLAPFFEFRYPHYGTLVSGDLQLELRAATEPWHVLGEEVSAGGTARYVDSSVERLQVKATGFTDSRYVVSCNGRRVPLRATGVRGEYVAGVRYRAWQPPSALHPAIGVHAPLTFDLIDTWNGRAVAGCRYHVTHPGGRSYETFPVNAFEAESRRVSRFHAYGHTPGDLPPPEPGGHLPKDTPRPMAPPPVEPDRDFPHTLDLRR